MMKRIILTLLIILLPSLAWGATNTIYVINSVADPGNKICYKVDAWPAANCSDGTDNQDLDYIFDSVADNTDTIILSGGVSGVTYTGTQIDSDGGADLTNDRFATGLTLRGPIASDPSYASHSGPVTIHSSAIGGTADNPILCGSGNILNITNLSWTDTDGGVFLQVYAGSSLYVDNITVSATVYFLYAYTSGTAPVNVSLTNSNITITANFYPLRVATATGALVFTGNTITALTNASGPMFYIQAGASANISNNVITGSGVYDADVDCISCKGVAAQTIQNNTITNCPGYSIQSENTITSLDISGNTITGGQAWGIYADTAAGSAIGTHKIYKNKIYDMAADTADDAVGIRFNITAAVYDNLIYNIRANGIDAASTGSDGSVVYNNTVYGTVIGHGICQQGGATNTKFANNISVKRSTDGGQAYDFVVWSGAAAKPVYTDNNIAWVEDGSTSNAVAVVNADGTTNYSRTQFANYQAATIATYTAASGKGPIYDLAGNEDGDANSLHSDPLFISTTNFHRQSTSPAIDAGVDVGLTTDYEGSPVPNGSAPDIGAYEYYIAGYYVDCNAASGGDGSPYNPWDAIADINGASFSPDALIFMKKGCTWSEQLIIPSSGTNGHPITFGAYGTGSNPLLLGGAVPGAAWGVYSGTTYEVTQASEPNIFLMLVGTEWISMINGKYWGHDKDTIVDHEWVFDTNKIYFRDDFTDPDSSTIYFSRDSSGECGILVDTKDYITIDGIDIAGFGSYYAANSCSGLCVSDSTGFIFRNGTISGNYRAGIAFTDDTSPYIGPNVTASYNGGNNVAVYGTTTGATISGGSWGTKNVFKYSGYWGNPQDDGEGIGIGSGTSSSTIAYNDIHHSASNKQKSDIGSLNAGLIVYQSDNNVIHHNDIHENYSTGMAIIGNGNSVYYNLLRSNSQYGGQGYNLTLVNNSGNPTGGGNGVYNNLIYGGGSYISSPGLGIGSTKPNVKNGAFTYYIGGVEYSKTANAAGTPLTGSNLPNGKIGAWAIHITTDGTIVMTEATANATGYDTTSAAVRGLLPSPTTVTKVGYVLVTNASGNAFVPGTTDLDTAGLTVSYGNLAGYGSVYWSSTNAWQNNNFKNNIIWGYTKGAVSNQYNASSDVNTSGTTFSTNIVGPEATAYIQWKGVNYSTLAAFQVGESLDSNSLSSDPLFVNAAGGGFSLQATSPCKDVGDQTLGLTVDYIGYPVFNGLWDIGAYEYRTGSVSTVTIGVSTQ